MNVGLDIGSTEFRSMRLAESRLLCRKIPACYCVLDDQISNRRLLDQAQIPFAMAKESLIIIGDSAIELAALVRCPVIPVIMEGHLPWNDPVGRQVCSLMIDALVPTGSGSLSHCTLTQSPFAGKPKETTLGFLENLLHLKGYAVSSLNPASALILSELEDSGFSGLGIVIGAETVALSLTHLGKPIFESVYGQGFRSVEHRFSLERHKYLWDAQGNQYLDLQSIKTWLRNTEISLDSPKSGDELWLVNQCRQLLDGAFRSMLTDLIRVGKQGSFKTRMPAVLSGGATKLAGFPQLVQQALNHTGVPLRTDAVRISASEPFSVAKGLLVNSTLATQAQREKQTRVA